MSGLRCVACGTRRTGAFAAVPYHSQACARLLLQRILVAVPGVIDLLPAEWRADLAPPTKQHNKRDFASGSPGPWRHADRVARGAR